ncbi:MAG: carboxypeptidase regulatory-like domain-containing protein, partial [Bacteroidetes bacterium]
MKSLYRFIVYVLTLSLITGMAAVAGNDGKIIGRVTDEKGEPLVGVNVLVVGTTRGASTDPDGKYVIIGVPIGSYT